MADENVIPMEARLKDFVSSQLQTIQINIDSFAKEGQKSFDKLKESIDANKKSADEHKDHIAELGKEIATTALTVSGLAFSMEKAGEFIKEGIEEAYQSSLMHKRLNFEIKALGQESQFSTEHLSKMAEEMSSLTDVDNDTILSAEEVALRFGVTADQMEKTTQAAMDLAKLTGQDVVSAMHSLTNATVNPHRAMMQLSREGIHFSETQKEAANQAASTGKELEALAIVVDGVEKNYSHLAQENPDLFKKMGKDAAEAGKSIGNFLLPTVEQLVKLLDYYAIGNKAFFDQLKSAGALIMPGAFSSGGDKKNGSTTNHEDAATQLGKVPLPEISGETRSLLMEDRKARLSIMIDSKEKELALEELKKQELSQKYKVGSEEYSSAMQLVRDERLAIIHKWDKAEADDQEKANAEMFQLHQEQKMKLRHIDQKERDALEKNRKDQEAIDRDLIKKANEFIINADKDVFAQLEYNQKKELETFSFTEEQKTHLVEIHARQRMMLALHEAQNVGGYVSGMLGNIMSMYHHHGAEYKAWAQAKNIVDTANAAMAAYAAAQNLPYPAGLVLGPIGAGLAIAAGAVQAKYIDAAHFEQGGFPEGPNALIRVNERGQEAVLNAQATARIGRSNIDSLNRGNEIGGNVYHVSQGATTIVIQGNADQNTVRDINISAEKRQRLLLEDLEEIEYRRRRT